MIVLQHTWTTLVAKNPMLIEIARFRRRFLSMNGQNALSGVILGTIGLVYLGFVLTIATYRSDIDPIVLVGFQMTLFVILAPLLLHSSIAGERERRSWDLLLAAPITKAQIVVGKFLAAVSAVGIGSAFFVFPIGITALSYHDVNFYNLALAELVCISFSILTCAITIFFSSRVKRSFMALGATLGVLCSALIVIPALLGSLGALGGSSYQDDTLMYLHPGFVFERIAEVSVHREGNPIHSVPATMYGLPQILIYLGLTAVALGWAINTLNFAENEVKFMPKAKS